MQLRAAIARRSGDVPLRAVVSFGPEHAPLEQRQVAQAVEEAQTLVPRPKLVVFAAFQFDPEAAKDIDETNWPGVTLLKAQMNADLLTEDLKKKRASNESFWLIGQPDVEVVGGEWLVDSNGRVVGEYECVKKLSGADSLAEINELGAEGVLYYAILSERRDLWFDLAVEAGVRFDPSEHRGGSGETLNRGIQTVFRNRARIDSRIGDLNHLEHQLESDTPGRFREFVEGLRRNPQIAQRLAQIPPVTLTFPLTTTHYSQITIHGFDYYNTKTGGIESGGADKIAVWLLDTDYDGRSLYPRQVFFPLAGEKEGWAKLARNLKAEVDEDRLEAYRGTVSLPFEPGGHRRIAVKIVDDRGIESLKVVGVG